MPWEHLILASQSPRRRDLLDLCGRPYEVRAADIDEKAIERKILSERKPDEAFSETAARLVQALAESKAEAVQKTAEHKENTVILGADTIVVLGEKIFGKPKDKAEAEAMLLELAGKTHSVYTGVALLAGAERELFAAATEVTFYPPDARIRRLIRQYAASASPLDKAGGYGIQDFGALLVKEIKGDFYNVIGLPLAETARRIDRLFQQPED